MDSSSSSSESSPRPKRHSFPAILTYSETLSVLSEHQKLHNNRKMTRRQNDVSTIDGKGSDEERREKLQQAMEWLKKELKDMHHQDKFLLRQFNHLNHSIQDLKEKQEMVETAKEEKQESTKEQLNEEQTNKDHEREQVKQDQQSLNESYDSDYGSDQSMDRFEEDYQLSKNNHIIAVSPKAEPKQRMTKRWTWWK